MTGKNKLDREKWENWKLTGENGKLMKLTGKMRKFVIDRENGKISFFPVNNGLFSLSNRNFESLIRIKIN